MSISVSYVYPVVGATAPTALKMSKLSEVQADIAFSADGDTTATAIVHNMDLTTNGAGGTPDVSYRQIAGAVDAAFGLIQTFVDANTIRVTKNTTGTGTTGTVRVTVRRPWNPSR